MAKKRHPAGSKKLHPVLTPQMHAYLADLAAIGHGPTASDVARYLLQREIDDLLRTKVLHPRGPDGEKV